MLCHLPYCMSMDTPEQNGPKMRIDSDWLPYKHHLWKLGTDFPIPISVDAWVRGVPHDTLGPPELIVEAFWITPPVFHRYRFEGWTEGGHQTSGIDRSVVGRERVSLETVVGTHLGPTDAESWVDFLDGTRRVDLPTFLIASHRTGGRDGYAVPPPPFATGHMTDRGEHSPLSRIDLFDDDDHPVLVDGRPIDNWRVRAWDRPIHLPNLGMRVCGIWIDEVRQYGVAVYLERAWLFTVPKSRVIADRIYDMIDRGD